MTIDCSQPNQRLLVALDTRVAGATYQVFFVHESDQEVIRIEVQDYEDRSTDRARYCDFPVDAGLFRLGGNYRVYVYAKGGD